MIICDLFISITIKLSDKNNSNKSLFINLEKSFLKRFFAYFLNSTFISMYDFSYLNLIKALCIFFNTNPRFSACFKFSCV